jgi:hypothetical protein
MIHYLRTGEEAMKISPIQKKVMQAMKKSNVDSSTAASIMTLLPLEEQQNVLLAWIEWFWETYNEMPIPEQYLRAMDIILKDIPTPGIRIVASAE